MPRQIYTFKSPKMNLSGDPFALKMNKYLADWQHYLCSRSLIKLCIKIIDKSRGISKVSVMNFWKVSSSLFSYIFLCAGQFAILPFYKVKQSVINSILLEIWPGMFISDPYFFHPGSLTRIQGSKKQWFWILTRNTVLICIKIAYNMHVICSQN